MPKIPIRYDSAGFDLSRRLQATETITASPADATETVIATLTLADFAELEVVSGIQLRGWAAFTVGANGVSANLRIRQTNVSGAVQAATGATTVAAAALAQRVCLGLDLPPGVGVYVLTLEVGSATTPSTVSAVYLDGHVV